LEGYVCAAEGIYVMKDHALHRTEITDAINRRNADINDRARHMGLIVEDKKIIADASKKLRLATTTEGAVEIKRAIAQATEQTHKEFARQNTDLENRFSRCRQAETQLRRRTQDARADARQIHNSAAQIRESRGSEANIANAERAAYEDARFTNQALDRQMQLRKAGEQRRQAQKAQLLSIGSNWPSFVGGPTGSAGIEHIVGLATPHVPSDVAGTNYQKQLDQLAREEAKKRVQIEKARQEQERREQFAAFKNKQKSPVEFENKPGEKPKDDADTDKAAQYDIGKKPYYDHYQGGQDQ